MLYISMYVVFLGKRICTGFLFLYFRWRSNYQDCDGCMIPSISFIFIRAYPKTRTSISIVICHGLFVFNDWRWWVAAVRLIDIGWIVDHHCWNLLFKNICWKLVRVENKYKDRIHLKIADLRVDVDQETYICT